MDHDLFYAQGKRMISLYKIIIKISECKRDLFLNAIKKDFFATKDP